MRVKATALFNDRTTAESFVLCLRQYDYLLDPCMPTTLVAEEYPVFFWLPTDSLESELRAIAGVWGHGLRHVETPGFVHAFGPIDYRQTLADERREEARARAEARDHGRKGGEVSAVGATVGEMLDEWEVHPRLTDEEAESLVAGQEVFTMWGPVVVNTVKRAHNGQPWFGGIPAVVVETMENGSYLPDHLSLFPLVVGVGVPEAGRKGGSAGSAVAEVPPVGRVGIDYGMGMSNVDRATGIRYGCICQHSLCQESLNDAMDPDYGDPSCPDCGGAVLDSSEVKHFDLWARRMDAKGQHGCFDYACLSCRQGFDSSSCFPEEAVDWTIDGGAEYDIQTCLDSDLMVTRSPFYTHAQYCSPCVPGAGSLDNPMGNGVKTFCLGHEWFDGEVAPYPVYRVSDDSRVPSRLESWRVEYRYRQGMVADEWFVMGTTFDSADHAAEVAANHNARWADREYRAVALEVVAPEEEESDDSCVAAENPRE